MWSLLASVARGSGIFIFPASDMFHKDKRYKAQER